MMMMMMIMMMIMHCNNKSPFTPNLVRQKEVGLRKK